MYARPRVAPWISKQEERLVRRRDAVRNFSYVAAGLIAILEALWPWADYTPGIHSTLHIAAVAIVLPAVYFLLQGDMRNKQLAFNRAMDDLGRRLLFLDPQIHPEDMERQLRYQGSLLQPTRQAVEQLIKPGKQQSLRDRFEYYYRALPHPVCEGDRMGFLSLLHPKTAVSWGLSIALVWLLAPGGLNFGPNNGLTWLPLLLPLYLVLSHFNARWAYEIAMYEWLKMG
jgi:hypothetical protein